MLDKEKVIEFLESEIELCNVSSKVLNESILWELERILERVKTGMLDAI